MLPFPGSKNASCLQRGITVLSSGRRADFLFFFISELSELPLDFIYFFFFCRSLSVGVLVSPASPSTLLPPDAHAPLLHSHNSAVTWQHGPSWTRHQPRCPGNRTHDAVTVNTLAGGSQRGVHGAYNPICIQRCNICQRRARTHQPAGITSCTSCTSCTCSLQISRGKTRKMHVCLYNTVPWVCSADL